MTLRMFARGSTLACLFAFAAGGCSCSDDDNGAAGAGGEPYG
jgi:hypothetical protein